MTTEESVVDKRRLWNMAKVARRLKVGSRRAGQLVDQGRLPVAVLTPLGRLFDPLAVEQFARQHARKPRTALAASGGGKRGGQDVEENCR